MAFGRNLRACDLRLRSSPTSSLRALRALRGESRISSASHAPPVRNTIGTMKPKTLILRAAGTNCDGETAHAFELAGAEAQFVHVNRLLERPETLDEFQLLAIPGGFSYGDDIAAGRILANQLTHHLK